MSKDEKDKMRARIIKLRNRKGKVDVGIKTCKNCGNEFHESSNFNWSCSIHSGQIDQVSGQWWCCGKKGLNAKGCKVQKHEIQNEVDEDDDDKQDNNDLKNQKYQRCQCCKQIGHSIDQCERDPNIKTKEDIETEFERVTQLKDFRKLFPDTQIATTIFLKKCIKVKKY